MTAEERMDRLLSEECTEHFPPPTAGLKRHDCGECLIAAIRAAEREAADEALERVAVYVAGAGVTGTERRVFGLLAAHISSLKSGGGSSGEGGAGHE